MQFSLPTFRSGYSVAVGVLKGNGDYWGFTAVFRWDVWLALLISGMVVSVLVWLAERDFTRRGMGKVKYPQEFRPGMYESVYRMYGKLLNTVDEPRVTSLPAKFMVMGWGVVVLVTIATYTAGLTARLTANSVRTKINGINDLGGQRVGTWDAIAKNFLKYGVRPRGLPWDNEADGLAMLDMVRCGVERWYGFSIEDAFQTHYPAPRPSAHQVATGQLDALILDNPWLRYQLADRCDITLVGRMFQYVNNAVGFNVHVPKEFIEAYNKVLSQLIEDGMYEMLELAYIRESRCGKADPTTTITFWNLTGVYLIMVACVGMGLLLMILPRVSSRFDMDIKGGTSLAVGSDRDRSFVSRTVSRIGRAFSNSGARPQASSFSCNGGNAAADVSSSRVVPVTAAEGAYTRKGSHLSFGAGAASVKEPPQRSCTTYTSLSASLNRGSPMPAAIASFINSGGGGVRAQGSPLARTGSTLASSLSPSASGNLRPSFSQDFSYRANAVDASKSAGSPSLVSAFIYSTGMPPPESGRIGRQASAQDSYQSADTLKSPSKAVISWRADVAAAGDRP
ncbi:hypothetical protein GPECTOR_29g2 [Gonium pectorale]|uniref:Ionotropic glutamate receptor C-terminal domain-containing protein n=1 Tax=Gonium pectorale TaxID=33097 RepID=A0A150GEH1_GONPE|nr:hypothetical protein GPECTOR_29g2 [Gonium pectorale]|eukprot:KXZ48239.1 hypothetical protein GPECTOR_29g2 [Gonium pectorale]